MTNLKFNLKQFQNLSQNSLKHFNLNLNVSFNFDDLTTPFYKKGNKILIKKENVGTFTKYCGGNVTNECIKRGEQSPSKKIRAKARFAKAVRSWQKGGEITKINWKKLMNDPEYKKRFNWHINPENMAVIEDSLINRNAGFPLRIATFSQIIPESGGETRPHGNGAYGLIGWRSSRAKGLPSNLSGQAHVLMEGLFGKGAKDWTRGKPELKMDNHFEMKSFFLKTPNVRKATNAIMHGFIRPEPEAVEKRLNFSEFLKKFR